MKPQTLNPLTLPLVGSHLIEASAGTGKTYNIAALFTRLVLLERLPLERILVVTFTKAATAELKTRLRAWLGQALALLRHSDVKVEAAVHDLVALARQQEDDTLLQMRLLAALNQFDAAAVYTIHGFCQRVLTDYAFLCGVPFDTETVPADPLLLRTWAQDYWRCHISPHPLYAPLVADAGLTPDAILDELGPWLTRSEIEFRLPEHTDLAAADHALQQQWAVLRRQLAAIEQAYWQIKPAKLSGTYFKDPTFQTLFAELWTAADSDNPHHPLTKADKLALFSADYLNAHTKGKQQLSEHETAQLAPLAAFGEALAHWQQTAQNSLLRIKIDTLAHVRQQWQAERRHSRQRGFDDLLADVVQALSPANPQADLLAKTLAEAWHIALVDECQDTDPLQYRIFKTAFAEQGRPLLMVGDPKQAIYRFRGADIHAYLQAASDTPPANRHTLDTNYRSHQTLLAGIGHLFAAKQHPFVLPAIDYTPVSAHRAESRLQPAQAALHIRWLNETPERNDQGGEKTPNKDWLRQRAAQWCADEIAGRLTAAAAGRCQLADEHGTRPLVAGDIAVLVRKHQEGSMIAAALRQRGIPCVSLDQQSVFASAEAEALAALMAWWLQPQQGGLLRFVLAGPLFGWDAGQLMQLNHDEAALTGWLERAQQAHSRWQQHGIYSALQSFATACDLESSLLARGAERSLTNFWQLAELLAAADHAGPAATSHWLQQQIAGHGQHSDEHQLRLESDADLVNIVTMHAAKGLEYPLVYCPFVWDGASIQRKSWQTVHHNGQAWLSPPELLDDDEWMQLQREQLGELLRLYYVAFTRAREQLVLYAAACRDTAYNPLAYLLGGNASDTPETVAALWQQADQPVSLLWQRWQQYLNQDPAVATSFAWHSGAPEPAHWLPSHESSAEARALVLPWRPLEHIRHTSFTALSTPATRHAATAGAEQAPDLDRGETATPPPDHIETLPEDWLPASAILTFPRGMQAGVCLHALLEETDFSRPAAEQQACYAPLLARHGFADIPAADLLPMIETVRHAPLWPDGCLADLPSAACLAEMDFMLQVTDFSLPMLQQWLAQPHIGLPPVCVTAARQLDFATVTGFVNGFIDLVCRDESGRVAVIDYKSNHLGFGRTDYGRQAMDTAMAEHHYYLQALIYAIATARYLAARHALPDTLSVRYLFLRGLEAGSTQGIWYWDLPTAALAPWLEPATGTGSG